MSTKKNQPPKIIFVGMPGSGKSTYGKLYAEKFKYPFYDLDHYIESEMGMKINQIVTDFGMSYFRILERKYLKKMAYEKDWFVLSCGGGTPCQFNNLDIIKSAGTSVYIHTPVQELFRRMDKKKSQQQRPLFNQLDKSALLEKIQDLYDQRHPFYNQADIILDQPSLNNIQIIK